MSEMIKQYSFVMGEEKVKLVPRYVPTNKQPDYSNSKALAIINKEIKAMAWEVQKSEKSSSTLVFDENNRVINRAYTKSTFPDYVQKTGAGSAKEFLKILSMKKGIRFNRVKEVAVDRLEKGYMNNHGYDEPDKKFLVASKQLHDNKNIIFRRIRGRLIPMRVPYQKRADLVPF